VWQGELVPGSIEKVVDGQTQLVPGMVATAKVSVLWVVAAYIVLTFGEVLLYPTALQLAFTAAPKSMKGLVTAVFLLTNTLGNFVNTFWTRTYGGSINDRPDERGSLAPGQFFGFTALMALAAAVACIFVGRRLQRQLESSAETIEA
jgi:POT family proton-dependent oligopeptide transporter